MDHLKDTLNELHQELSSGTPVDSETQALLVQVSADIQQFLAHQTTSAKDEVELATKPEKESLLDQTLSLTEEFEESHPKLAEIIGRIASALSRIGI